MFNLSGKGKDALTLTDDKMVYFVGEKGETSKFPVESIEMVLITVITPPVFKKKLENLRICDVEIKNANGTLCIVTGVTKEAATNAGKEFEKLNVPVLYRNN